MPSELVYILGCHLNVYYHQTLLCDDIYSCSSLCQPTKYCRRSKGIYWLPFWASCSSFFGTPTILGTMVAFARLKAYENQLARDSVAKRATSTRLQQFLQCIKQQHRTHLPPPHIPGETPQPPRQYKGSIGPPPGTYQLTKTYICECAIRNVSIPTVLNLVDLAVFAGKDLDLGLNNLLATDALHLIACLEIHIDRIAGGGHAVGETLDFGKCCL